MAWSWSHTQEAYDNAYNNLSNKDREFLEICYAEIKAYNIEHEDEDGYKYYEEFSEEVYKPALAEAKELPTDILVDFIWEFASEFATCDNGGFNAWMCPYGCGCHTVSFSRPDEEDYEE